MESFVENILLVLTRRYRRRKQND